MSKQDASSQTTTQTSSSTSEPSISTPGHNTPSAGSSRSAGSGVGLKVDDAMADKEQNQNTGASDRTEPEVPVVAETETKQPAEKDTPRKRKVKCRKPEHQDRKHATKSRGRKAPKDESESDISSQDESDSDDSDAVATKRKAKKSKQSRKAKEKKNKSKSKSKHQESDSESDSSDSDSSDESSDLSSSEDEPKKRKTKKKKTAKDKKASKSTKAGADESESEDEVAVHDDPATVKALQLQIAQLQLQAQGVKAKKKSTELKASAKTTVKATMKKGSPLYKRVDQLWDNTTHQYKLKESAEEDDSEFAEFAFLVRRTFNWKNEYQSTVVDIKSKQLRAALIEVLKDCKSVSLEAEEPHIDPNVLFLYLEELRSYYKKTMKTKIKAERKKRKTAKKMVKKLKHQKKLVKMLVEYIDEDYADTKKTLYPLLKAGNITFDLLWALFHPNDIAVTSCYGTWDEPRCFQVEYANKYSTMSRGQWYCIEGKYMEYDGKSFGFGDFEVDVEGFKGPRKITSLATYPLKYHKDPEKVKKQIIERGERFVNTEGTHYKFHKGLAFMKKKKQVLKINVNGRIMIDPATFRRINPNYPIAWIKPKDDGDLFSLGDDSDESDDCCCGQDSDDDDADGGDRNDQLENKYDEDRTPKYQYKWEKDDAGHTLLVAVEVDDDGDPIQPQHVDRLAENPELRKRSFTEDELLLTSPVMLGFAFSEKLWLEFTISGVHEITYNEDAFDSLVLPPNQKSIVKALVESHKIHAAKTIDDVVQGKGKGLVAVLHGPPGTGKTLTAEGISELLKCPLYMVSAGELGTDPARLEHELQKILDIAHSWGAVLLLDEADVFLEKREVHDIHRNALVSIFLRLLEYFQGILFLTTNRVGTFDEAFQSRIHVALKYGELTHKAKKAVWKMFLERVKKIEGVKVAELSDYDLEVLSRNSLNGRQIKNLVSTAHALALNEKATLTLEHIKRVLDVAESFDHDLKGGTGYVDAMRSYT